MNAGRGGSGPELLVATGNQSFGEAVVDAVERTDVAASAEHVAPSTGGSIQCDTGEYDGAIVDGLIAESGAVIECLTEKSDVPVVLLSESPGEEHTITRALEAGAIDVFPRTTATAQYRLVVKQLVTNRSPTSAREEAHAYGEAYEALFEKISEGLVVHDPETGVIVDVNERFCEMNGYRRSELLGEPIGIVMTDQEAYGPEAAKEMIQRARTDGPQQFEWRNQHRNGETFPVEVDLTVIELDGTERVLASIQDITERKRREQEYEQIFNGVKDPIAVFNPDTGEITEVNDPYHDMIGYDDLETIQELGIGGLSADGAEYTAERGTKLIREANTTGEPKTVEWEVVTASGDRRYLDITLSPAVIRGEERVLTIQRDVTERKRREQEYEQIFNGVQDAIAVFDPDTLEYLDANEAYLEMFGHASVSELRDRGVSGLSITEEGYTEQRGRELHQRVAESRQPEIVEWQGETSGGERIWLEVKVAPAVIGGELRTVSIQRDITERKRRKQRLEVFNRILRHNLRNQLDVIQSHAEELADRTDDHHAERIVAAVNELAEIGRRARRVDQILSKTDTLTEVDLTQTLRETVETMEATGSDVTVTTELPREARLRTDQETVTVAVESALENALEHAASAVTVAVDDGPDECVITITDDGPGIPDEELTPIEAQTETRLQHGRGLGLWQLRWCVDNLDGELSFMTDAGTTVRITVPNQRKSNHQNRHRTASDDDLDAADEL